MPVVRPREDLIVWLLPSVTASLGAENTAEWMRSPCHPVGSAGEGAWHHRRLFVTGLTVHQGTAERMLERERGLKYITQKTERTDLYRCITSLFTRESRKPGSSMEGAAI